LKLRDGCEGLARSEEMEYKSMKGDVVKMEELDSSRLKKSPTDRHQSSHSLPHISELRRRDVVEFRSFNV